MTAIVPPQIEITQRSDVTLLQFVGSEHGLSEDIVHQIADDFLKVAEANPPAVVIDLDGVSFLGSSFLELLFRVWNRLKARGGSLALCQVQKYCREVFEVTNLTEIWTIYDSVEDAIQAINSPTSN